MDYLMVGKYVSTHGLKGEIKILCDAREPFFEIGMTIYIGNKKEPFTIKSYRKHQKYDMITLEGLDSIEKVLPYKGLNIFVDKNILKDKIISIDLIGYDVYNNNLYIGKVIEVLKGIKYDMIVVGDTRIIIPLINEFIISTDRGHKTINVNYYI